MKPAAASGPHERNGSMKSISVDDLAALGPGVPIIDVREEDEYAEASVPGTRNVPLSRFQQSMGDVPAGQTVYVMCASGGRSSRATAAPGRRRVRRRQRHGRHHRVVPQRPPGHLSGGRQLSMSATSAAPVRVPGAAGNRRTVNRLKRARGS